MKSPHPLFSLLWVSRLAGSGTVAGWLLLLLFGWTLLCSPALQAAALVPEVDYHLITPPAPKSGSKPEVVEVFNFKCPHCFHLHPVFAAWETKNRDKYTIKHLPVYWGTQSDLPVKAYYAAEFMGKGNEMLDAIFRAQFETKMDIENIKELTMVAQDLGLDGQKFQSHINSFGVNAKMAQAKAMQKSFGVNSTPSVVINGRYMIMPNYVGGNWEKMMQHVEILAVK